MTTLIASARLAADWHAQQALDRANRAALSNNPEGFRHDARMAALRTAKLFYMAKPDLPEPVAPEPTLRWEQSVASPCITLPHEHHYEAVPGSSSNHPMVWCPGCFKLALNPGT